MRSYFLTALLVFGFWYQIIAQETLSIQGVWKFQIDRNDVGLKEEWFKNRLNDSIKLPGSMVENGKGDALTLKTQWTGSIYDSSWFFNPRMAKFRQEDNLKFPFWLTPDKYYCGAAWYQKELIIPQHWENKKVVLFLERPHWETMVWVDEMPFGMQNSLSVPHLYNLGDALTPGRHLITIRVDNRTKEVNPGPDSHSITDHTQGNWNGIAGRIELIQKSPVSMEDVQVYPNIQSKSVEIVITLQNSLKKASGSILTGASLINTSKKHVVKTITTKFETEKPTDTIRIKYYLGEDIALWDEFYPSVYKLTVELTTKKKLNDTKEVLFGMRDFKANGTRFEINGRSTFLRGTVENCVFPLTGYAPMDEESWTRVFKICKANGLNHMRFHSFCPPEAAFVAADKLGFYLQPEGPSWANHGSSLGDGRPIDKYILDETARIIKEYGNHPSFCMFAYGNEPRGRYVPYLDKWVVYWRNKDKRRLYTGASIGGSWQIIPESEFLVRAKPRGLPFSKRPNSEFDFRANLEDQKKPYVSHEVGQYCVFPNFKEINKYTGPLKAKNFELFSEDLSDKNMAGQAEDFLMASGKLQLLCYKAEFEAAFRTPGFAGFQMLSLNDYPGQGSALVGLLDAFWDEKGYANAKEIIRFCNPTVPLVRFPKFVFTNNETMKVDAEVAHFGFQPITDAKILWTIKDIKDTEIAKGELPSKTIGIDNCISLGNIEFPLNNITIAGKFVLELSVSGHSNSWEFFVYPEKLPETDTSGIYFTSIIDEKAETILKDGGKVFLTSAGKVENGKDVVQHFTPVFWNTSWFKMRPPHTTGILVQNTHPAFKDFPTDYHSNYQWWELTNRQQVMNLDSFPADFIPLVQPIDTWFINRKLGIVFEANVEKGKIIVCSANLSSEERPVSRQLFYSLTKYMNSPDFNPKSTVSISVIKELFEVKARKGFDSFTKGSPDELKPNFNKNTK